MMPLAILLPGQERLRADCTKGVCSKSVPTRMKLAVDEGVSGKEVLGLIGRLEVLHLPLSTPGWSMRVLSPVHQIPALSVLHIGKQLALGDAIAAQSRCNT